MEGRIYFKLKDNKNIAKLGTVHKAMIKEKFTALNAVRKILRSMI